jgi:hypothetical protein
MGYNIFAAESRYKSKPRKDRSEMVEKKDQNNCKVDTGKLIKGIVCDVKNCAYHSGDCFCTAKQIAVGPGHAETSADTICSTFKQKAEF